MLISNMFRTGCTISQIINTLQVQEKLNLSKEQVRNILKIKRKSYTTAETVDLEQYVMRTGGLSKRKQKMACDIVVQLLRLAELS